MHPLPLPLPPLFTLRQTSVVDRSANCGCRRTCSQGCSCGSSSRKFPLSPPPSAPPPLIHSFCKAKAVTYLLIAHAFLPFPSGRVLSVEAFWRGAEGGGRENVHHRNALLSSNFRWRESLDSVSRFRHRSSFFVQHADFVDWGNSILRIAHRLRD